MNNEKKAHNGGMTFVDGVYNEMSVQSVVRDRKIHVNDDVDDVSMFKCMYYMDKLKRIDDIEEIPMNERKPIEFVVNSYGGQCYEGLGLISKIEQFKEMGYEIITTLTGKGMSMGSSIFVVGGHRRMYRYGTLMIHQVSSGFFGKYKDMQEDLQETERIWNVLADIVIENSNVTLEDIKKVTDFKRDWYLNAEQCLELGICDEII